MDPAEADGLNREPLMGLPLRAGSLPVIIDPDAPVHRARFAPDVLAAIAVGGALGSVARWALDAALPHAAAALPVATLVTNVLGALLIGVVAQLTRRVRWRLFRPLLGVGFLGGFTTFSTYVLQVWTIAGAGALPLALGYLGLATALGLAAAWLGGRLAAGAGR